MAIRKGSQTIYSMNERIEDFKDALSNELIDTTGFGDHIYFRVSDLYKYLSKLRWGYVNVKDTKDGYKITVEEDDKIIYEKLYSNENPEEIIKDIFKELLKIEIK